LLDVSAAALWHDKVVVAASTAAATAAALLLLAVVAFILLLEVLHLSYQSCVARQAARMEQVKRQKTSNRQPQLGSGSSAGSSDARAAVHAQVVELQGGFTTLSWFLKQIGASHQAGWVRRFSCTVTLLASCFLQSCMVKRSCILRNCMDNAADAALTLLLLVLDVVYGHVCAIALHCNQRVETGSFCHNW
jgi:hypothetical protein